MPRWAVRTLFVTAVAALPLQLVVREVAAEPYPGLYQPSFGGAVEPGRTYTTLEPRVTVQDADRSSRRVDYHDVLPPTGVLPATVFMTAFRDEQRAHAPETARWLRQQLLRIEPDADPRTVTVEWVHVERERGGTSARVADVESTDTIDVGAAR